MIETCCVTFFVWNVSAPVAHSHGNVLRQSSRGLCSPWRRSRLRSTLQQVSSLGATRSLLKPSALQHTSTVWCLVSLLACRHKTQLQRKHRLPAGFTSLRARFGRYKAAGTDQLVPVRDITCMMAVTAKYALASSHAWWQSLRSLCGLDTLQGSPPAGSCAHLPSAATLRHSQHM